MTGTARWQNRIVKHEPGPNSPTLIGAGGHRTRGLVGMGLISPRSMVQIHLAPQTNRISQKGCSHFCIWL